MRVRRGRRGRRCSRSPACQTAVEAGGASGRAAQEGALGKWPFSSLSDGCRAGQQSRRQRASGRHSRRQRAQGSTVGGGIREVLTAGVSEAGWYWVVYVDAGRQRALLASALVLSSSGRQAHQPAPQSHMPITPACPPASQARECSASASSPGAHKGTCPHQLLGPSGSQVTVWGGFGPDHTVPSTPRPLTGTYSYLLTHLRALKLRPCCRPLLWVKHMNSPCISERGNCLQTWPGPLCHLPRTLHEGRRGAGGGGVRDFISWPGPWVLGFRV